MIRRLSLLLVALALSAASATTAVAASPTFEATFHQIYSQCANHPPTLVFCGEGTIAGYGAASSTASLTGPLVPIAGTDCVAIKAVRRITMDDGSGTLTLTETGTKCPPSAAAGMNGMAGDPYTVAKTYWISGGTGVFAGASGSGSDINRSGGNSQVSVLSGTLAMP
jgi:hypothetical protein